MSDKSKCSESKLYTVATSFSSHIRFFLDNSRNATETLALTKIMRAKCQGSGTCSRKKINTLQLQLSRLLRCRLSGFYEEMTLRGYVTVSEF